ncbi:hypothetical protein D3C81_446340 [compost metagenome]
MRRSQGQQFIAELERRGAALPVEQVDRRSQRALAGVAQQAAHGRDAATSCQQQYRRGGRHVEITEGRVQPEQVARFGMCDQMLADLAAVHRLDGNGQLAAAQAGRAVAAAQYTPLKLNAEGDVLAGAHPGPVPVAAQDQGRSALAGRLAPYQAGHRLTQGPQRIQLARPEVEQRRRQPAVRRKQGRSDDSAHGRTIRPHTQLCIHVYIAPDWV